MGQSLDQQPLVRKGMAQTRLEGGLRGVELHRLTPFMTQSIALKKRSPRQVQKYRIDAPAEENMIRSARPIRFS